GEVPGPIDGLGFREDFYRVIAAYMVDHFRSENAGVEAGEDFRITVAVLVGDSVQEGSEPGFELQLGPYLIHIAVAMDIDRAELLVWLGHIAGVSPFLAGHGGIGVCQPRRLFEIPLE